MSQDATRVRQCHVCGIATDQNMVYEKWGYPIWRCLRCGLGSTDVSSGFDPSSLYNAGYFQGAGIDGYADYVGSESVLRAEFRRAVAYLRRYTGGGDRLLEIGCAFGFFLLEAERYYRCIGCDISHDAVRYAHKRGLKVYSDDLSGDFLKSMGPFDVVVLLDVIEHLPDPAGALTRIHGALAKGGCVMLTTGDWGSFLARMMGRHWTLMTPPQHLSFFSVKTLEALLRRTGFKVIDSKIPWKRVPLGLAMHQLLSRFRLKALKWDCLNRIGIPVNLFDTVCMVARNVS